MEHAPSHRLPTTVRPERYDLHIAPDLTDGTVEGRVTIRIHVEEPVDALVLHAVGLDIGSAELRLNGRNVSLTPTYRPEVEMVELRPDEADLVIPVGEADLELTWTGRLTDDLVGFYRSTYTDDGGVERVIACTQFESTHARRAFPCWDEPAFKAVFSTSLLVDPDLMALANGAEASSDITDDGRRLVRFAPTIPLSTYLVAFVVGPLEATDPVDVDGVPLRVVTPLGRLHLAEFALEVGEFALRHLAGWYDIPYPGDKIDLVAIPDFSFGAMENQGCITFRETALLLDLERSTRAERMRIADVIAHELAHMWFGNLVTMRWWEGIWLNEAFATFMELVTSDAFRPDWRRWVEFGLARSAAFDTDSLTSTRPIEFEVVTADDAEAMFDVLTYEKGSSLVRMLEQHLGEDAFREGLRHYLRTHREGNTVTSDLWDAIEASTGEPVRTMMDTWILRGGHPVVSVESEDDRTLVLRQRRFTYRSDPAAGVTPVEETDRVIPLGIRVGTGDRVETRRMVLDGPETRIGFDEPVTWVIANNGGHGFHRVELDDTMLARTAAVAHERLTSLERFGLVEDEWAALLAGRGGVGRLLELCETLAPHETETPVWRRILAVLHDIDHVLQANWTPGLRPRFAQRVRGLILPALFGPDGDGAATDGSVSDGDAELQAALRTTLALVGGDPAQQVAAARLFDRLGSDPSATDPESAAAAIRIVAADADAERWDEILRRARIATTAQERLRHHGALADSSDPDLAHRFVDLVFSEEIRAQDGPFLLRRALGNPHTGATVWDGIERRWSEVVGRFAPTSIPRMLEGVTSATDPAWARRVDRFLTEHPLPGAEQLIAQHRERMWVTVALAAELPGALEEALADR